MSCVLIQINCIFGIYTNYLQSQIEFVSLFRSSQIGWKSPKEGGIFGFRKLTQGSFTHPNSADFWQ